MNTYVGFTGLGRRVKRTMQRLRRYYPRSFLKLILIGFFLVVLPLISALIYSAISVNRIAEQNRKTVYQAEQIEHGSRTLVSEVVAMEHSVQLSSILRDPSLLSGYLYAHQNFETTAASLSALTLNRDQSQLLNQLRTSEHVIYQKVTAVKPTPQMLTQEVTAFLPLLDTARNFLDHGLALIENEVNATQKLAIQTRKIVIWQVIGLIPLVVLLSIGFSVLITRPIRQIDEAIRRMGQGQLTIPVLVNGPQDIMRLGVRLDWTRQRLLELEEQKTRFLQHISHELKTPLTSIREGADLLAEGVIGTLSVKQQRVAEILLSNSVQLQKLIEDLLNYSVLQTQNSVFNEKKFEFRQILDTVLRDQDLAIMNKNLHIELTCSDWVVACDEQKVRVIVDNLLSNAIKFSPRNARIEIRASCESGYIYLDVIDEGVGIDPIDRDRIFDAFYRGRRTSLSTVQGTGLGLSIAREYAWEHGGNIQLMEDAVKGAHFRMSLPLSAEVSSV